MIGERFMFLDLKPHEGIVSFKVSDKGKFIGIGEANQLGKFDSKVDKCVFLGCSNTSKAFRVFNSRPLVVEESIHVKFNKGLTFEKRLSYLKDDFVDL
ncbi:hypothetical protein CR513_20935, partial [Mucuna pruriens]